MQDKQGSNLINKNVDSNFTIGPMERKQELNAILNCVSLKI
jgi:hypothetical protein